MLTDALYLLVMVNLALIGALPLIFFSRGSFNVRWFLTASPFALSATAVAATWLDVLQPWGSETGSASASETLRFAAAILSAASIYLIGFTRGAHRIPLALWHQDDDAPAEIVTWGPYAWIRHPFYTAFVMAVAAAFSAAPSLATLVPAAFATAAVALTARREERRLVASELGTAYAAYATKTGRFLPGIGRLPDDLRSRTLTGAVR